MIPAVGRSEPSKGRATKGNTYLHKSTHALKFDFPPKYKSSTLAAGQGGYPASMPLPSKLFFIILLISGLLTATYAAPLGREELQKIRAFLDEMREVTNAYISLLVGSRLTRRNLTIERTPGAN
ncbi:hypothetical protein GGU11DRAFT_746897 [Lentinula aff. detonsa]|nr:hypothetical protein GGU11DRAFT_746897 [Lentinula aff. detonsa]